MENTALDFISIYSFIYFTKAPDKRERKKSINPQLTSHRFSFFLLISFPFPFLFLFLYTHTLSLSLIFNPPSYLSLFFNPPPPFIYLLLPLTLTPSFSRSFSLSLSFNLPSLPVSRPFICLSVCMHVLCLSLLFAVFPFSLTENFINPCFDFHLRQKGNKEEEKQRGKIDTQMDIIIDRQMDRFSSTSSSFSSPFGDLCPSPSLSSEPYRPIKTPTLPPSPYP